MKVIFAGTPEFAAVALEAIIGAGFEVPLKYSLSRIVRLVAVCSCKASAVKQVALKHGIQVAPARLFASRWQISRSRSRSPCLYERHRTCDGGRCLWFDSAIVGTIDSAFGLSQYSRFAITTLARRRTDPSGDWAGDTETGITIMQMEEGLDTGPMLAKQAVPILPQDTTASMHDKLAELGGSMIVSAYAILRPDD